MSAYSKLRDLLAEAYPDRNSWRKASVDSGIDPDRIDLHGSALQVWTNILKELRGRDRLAGLRATLEGEFPPLLAPFDEYAAAVAKDEPDLPDFQLELIEVTENDLEDLDQSLDLATALPIPLVELALNSTPGSKPGDFDELLSGGNTAAVKRRMADVIAQRADDLRAIERQLADEKKRTATAESRIRAIETARLPGEPTRPNTANASTERIAYLTRQYDEAVANHRTALARYNEDKAQLPALRAEMDAARREAGRLVISIARQKAETQAAERAFLDDIAEARDRDLLLELDSCIDGALAAFAAEQPFRGFSTLLGARALLDFLRGAFHQPGAARDVEDRLAREADEVMDRVEAGISAIAKVSLATTLVIDRTLQQNRAALKDLVQRLSGLPLAELDSAIVRARSLESEKAPEIPAFEHLERAEDINRIKAQLAEMDALATAHVNAVSKEIDAEAAARGQELEAAQSDARSTIAAMQPSAISTSKLLGGSRILWQLIGRAAGNEGLPPIVRGLSGGLLREAARRQGTAADLLIADADQSNFGLYEARAAVKEHTMTVYIEMQRTLTRHLETAKKRVAAVAKVIGEAGDHTGVVARRYRSNLTVATVMAAFPVIGLGASIWGVTLAKALKPLVSSDDKSYADLGRFALRALTWTSVITAIMACATTAMTLVFFGDGLLDMSGGTTLAAVALVCIVTFLVSIRNAWVIRPFVRKL